MKKSQAIKAVVFGVVQGVGFRPFVYRLAHRFGYNGWVKNIGFGVEIHVESRKLQDFNPFFQALRIEKPPLSQIEKIDLKPDKFLNCSRFEIQKTEQSQSFVFISPDISICDNCKKEIMDPKDRRSQYPFINCTDCGPRYTIVKALPYDRNQTTMSNFQMCPQCQKEFTDPLDRRYHAQPIACPECGPEVELKHSSSGENISGGIQKAASLIREGAVLAVKGLGGFHLVCDPFNEQAVQKLRTIKKRKIKPFALMAFDLNVIHEFAHMDSAEKEQLCSARRPIVLLRKKKDIPGIAPHLKEMGFMLPYTPLHYLLLQDLDLIVATSSNPKDAPIFKQESKGLARLCDYILTHNRPIHMRADDSVMKIVDQKPLFLRRARGYVPYPQSVPESLASSQQILALGGELKDTISLYKNGYVITSQFLGDLNEYQNYKYFEETLEHLSHLFEFQPDAVASDLHPDFHTTRYAQRMGIPHFKVQHHYAHALATMLEHQIEKEARVLGVILDGFGYGGDGTAWGAEFLVSDYQQYQRIGHFKYMPLPGGDLAAKQPWRMALSYLMDAYEEKSPSVPSLSQINSKQLRAVQQMIQKDLCTPPASSCGRLFDAVSYLIGLSPPQVEFEAEAPMRLEAIADENTPDCYGFQIREDSLPYVVSFSKTIRAIIRDLDQKIPESVISARFHNTLLEVIIQISEKVRQKQGINTIVLAGGVFLNQYLLSRTTKKLRNLDFEVLRPVQYSPNDELISLGQIAYALARPKK
ncbi:MAG: carbamoyltransferase HypF [Candidatus Aminicenantes bacterium]|nr:carbamoyltransferase HypF [Candidatus Aminicenantes bacterium]